jgi:type IV pilus assembly protein PilN
MIRVNLLAVTPGAAPPRVWLPPEHRSAIAGLLMLVVTASSVGGWWWMLDSDRANVDLSIANAEAEIERLKGVAKLVDYATARKAELAERLNLIERLRAGERAPVTLLETVNKSMPDGLWLLDLKQTGKMIQIEGQALSITYVTAFSEQLQESGIFARPVDVNTKTEVVQDTSVIHFVLKAGAVDKTAPAAVAPSATGAPAAPAAPAAAKGTSGG